MGPSCKRRPPPATPILPPARYRWRYRTGHARLSAGGLFGPDQRRGRIAIFAKRVSLGCRHDSRNDTSLALTDPYEHTCPHHWLGGNPACHRQTYGTTVRVFHPQIEAWRAVWLNPVAGKRNDLIGRRVGDDIVQFCLDADRPEKWVFSRITARSFLWRAFLLGDDGVTWHADTEFQLHRTA